LNQGFNQSHIRVMPGSHGNRRPVDAAPRPTREQSVKPN
jgi:hypothetical protein